MEKQQRPVRDMGIMTADLWKNSSGLEKSTDKH